MESGNGTKITEATPLHLYTFMYDGTVKYDRCHITRMAPNHADYWGGKEIVFRKDEDPNGYTGYSDSDEIDCRCRVGKTMQVLLTEPDFHRAKRIACRCLEESMKRKLEDLDRMHSHYLEVASSEL